MIPTIFVSYHNLVGKERKRLSRTRRVEATGKAGSVSSGGNIPSNVYVMVTLGRNGKDEPTQAGESGITRQLNKVS